MELQQAFLGPAKADRGHGSDRSWRPQLSGPRGYEIGGRAAFYSVPAITPDGELRLTTCHGGVCADGDEGTYPWSLSPGGTILTIEPGTDDCAVRAQVIPGTYERAACGPRTTDCLGELEAGDYASHYFEPRPQGEWAARHGALAFAVPTGWAAYADWPNVYGITTAQYTAFNGVDCYDCAVPGT